MPEKQFKRKKEVAWRDIAGEMVVMDLKGMKIRGFNETASFIWNKLDGEKSLIDIAKIYSHQFDLNYEQALGDVEEFVGELVEKELVEEIRIVDSR